MKKICLALVVLLIAAAVPAVSAETITGSIYDPIYEDHYPSSATIDGFHSSRFYGPNIFKLQISHTAREYPERIDIRKALILQSMDNYLLTDNHRSYAGTLGAYADVEIVYDKVGYNVMGQYGVYDVKIYIDWDTDAIKGLTGVTSYSFGGFAYNPSTAIYFSEKGSIAHPASYLYYQPSQSTVRIPYSETQVLHYQMQKGIVEQYYVITSDDYGVNLNLTRKINGVENPSKVIVKDIINDEIIYETDYIGTNASYSIPGSGFSISLESLYNQEYLYEIYRSSSGNDPDPTPDDNTTVTVYAQNSQTGALIANAHIDISASVNGTLHEVVNKTIPSGIYSIELQPTGGGMPNPDFYRLITTAEGYNSIMPYIDFQVDMPTTIYAVLDPIAGAPEDENKTFIDFYVRDLAANGISGATVNFGGYTLITNSVGYTIFEVSKNGTYTYTVSKSGYGSLTGNAVIGADPRHTINTVLAPAVTPTKPTPIPTLTPISPTPTMTAPSGEPVSNWLEWFASHFGMILGGGVEIGKIFMWLCFSVPVGVYVGKESKAGAAGFVAGAGIVTLFFVLIGWVPIWLLVLLALIIGLLYAKVFNSSDMGGGR